MVGGIMLGVCVGGIIGLSVENFKNSGAGLGLHVLAQSLNAVEFVAGLIKLVQEFG